MKSINKISDVQKTELILENEKLKAIFLPHDGGRLISLTAKPGDREFIWTNARTSSLIRYHGADYDNLSAGGVEEAFPSVYPDSYDGYELPFFGEIWSAGWDYEELATGWKMYIHSSAYPTRVSKEWTIHDDGIRCSYEISNLSGLTLYYLFGVHPSLNIKPDDRINIPGDTFDVGVMFPENLTTEKSFSWPKLGERDMRVPASQNACEYLQICTQKPEGIISVESESDGASLDITFDKSYFKSFCAWLIYGGWRGHYCLMTEFFSGWPLVLSEAAASKKCTCLKPWETVKTDVFYKIR